MAGGRGGLGRACVQEKREEREEEEEEEAGEKVFVRIDDYLSREVSKALERSYSADYLNQSACARARTSCVRVPGAAAHADDTLNLETCAASATLEQQGVLSGEQASVAQFTEYRSAPYDLRYWSILKLLEEERQQAVGSSQQIPMSKWVFWAVYLNLKEL